MKPDKANQKSKEKEHSNNNRTIGTTWRIKKNPSIGFKLEIGSTIN